MRFSIFFGVLVAFLISQPSSLAETKTLASGSVTSKDMRIQQFVGKINLDTVDNSMPFTLNFTNSKFSWMRVFLTDSSAANISPQQQPRGMMIVNENSFKGKSTAIVDMTGRMRSGTTVLLMRGAGVPGSTFNWTLTTVTGTKITRVEPSKVQSGGKLTLTGGGFSQTPAQNIVTLNADLLHVHNKTLKVVDATADSITAEVPALDSGTYTMTVTANGVTSNPVNVKISGQPEITGTNWKCVHTTMQFEIYGKNFSETASENEVKIGTEVAPISGCTSEMLTVTTPLFPDAGGANYFMPPLSKPLTVKVGPVPAKNSWSIYIGQFQW